MRTALPLVDVHTAPFSAKPFDVLRSHAIKARLSRKGVKNKQVLGGRYIGYTCDNSSGRIHVLGSVISQLGQGLSLCNSRVLDGKRIKNRRIDGSKVEGIDTQAIRYCKVAGKGRLNILFIVDTSGSMLSAERLALIKGCVVSLLKDAYVKRTRVALVSYGAARARLVIPFTTSPELAARKIDSMRGGGDTPLVSALAIAARLVDSLQGEPAEVILFSDGRYDRSSSTSTINRIRSFALFCKRKCISIHLVGAGSGTKTAQRRLQHFAGMLYADFHPLEDMRI